MVLIVMAFFVLRRRKVLGLPLRERKVLGRKVLGFRVDIILEHKIMYQIHLLNNICFH